MALQQNITTIDANNFPMPQQPVVGCGMLTKSSQIGFLNSNQSCWELERSYFIEMFLGFRST